MATREIADSPQLGYGTAFPVSPTAGDRFYRSDRDIQYFYDGTRWLSAQLFESVMGPQVGLLPRAATTLAQAYGAYPGAGLYDLYVEDALFVTLLTADTASWTSAIVRAYGAGLTATIASHTFASPAANTWVKERVTVASVIDADECDLFRLDLTENSGAASCYGFGTARYRYVG